MFKLSDQVPAADEEAMAVSKQDKSFIRSAIGMLPGRYGRTAAGADRPLAVKGLRRRQSIARRLLQR